MSNYILDLFPGELFPIPDRTGLCNPSSGELLQHFYTYVVIWRLIVSLEASVSILRATVSSGLPEASLRLPRVLHGLSSVYCLSWSLFLSSLLFHFLFSFFEGPESFLSTSLFPFSLLPPAIQSLLFLLCFSDYSPLHYCLCLPLVPSCGDVTGEAAAWGLEMTEWLKSYQMSFQNQEITSAEFSPLLSLFIYLFICMSVFFVSLYLFLSVYLLYSLSFYLCNVGILL